MKKIFCWATLSLVFILDRLLKIWALLHLKEGEGFPVWDGVLHVTRVNNTGAAFGLWKNASIFLTWVSVIFLFFVFFYLRSLFKGAGEPRNSVYGWALIAGGALGNLVDRVHFGYVIDYIDFRVWPVFNVADSSICLGAAWILLQHLLKKKTTG